MIFIINDDGSKREVLNIEELQELARQGIVLPETKIEAKGRVINAGKIKELTGVFIAARIRRQNEAAADSEKKAESGMLSYTELTSFFENMGMMIKCLLNTKLILYVC